MKFTGNRLKKLTFVKVTGYLFAFAVCAKVVALYASQHPIKEELLFVRGVVEKMRLGGEGHATTFRIRSEDGTFNCSSYYGKVWPGMERIEPGDTISVLLERNKINRNELISGRRYYIWEIIHQNNVIVAYDDVREMVHDKETTENWFINVILVMTGIMVVIAYLRKLYLRDD